MKHLRLNVLLSLLLAAALLAGCGGETKDAAQDTAAAQTETEAGESSGSLSFEGVDMDGNTVTEAVFTQSRLTNVAAVPTTFFVDESGTIQDTVVGAKEKAV